MWLAFLTNSSSFAHSLIAFFENVTHVGQCDGPVFETCLIVAVSPRDCACSIKALTGSLSGIANVSSASWEPYPIIHKFLLDLSYTCNFHFFFLRNRSVSLCCNLFINCPCVCFIFDGPGRRRSPVSGPCLLPWSGPLSCSDLPPDRWGCLQGARTLRTFSLAKLSYFKSHIARWLTYVLKYSSIST